jgi:hypothetical protein
MDQLFFILFLLPRIPGSAQFACLHFDDFFPRAHRMDGWVDGWDGWMDGWTATVT